MLGFIKNLKSSKAERMASDKCLLGANPKKTFIFIRFTQPFAKLVFNSSYFLKSFYNVISKKTHMAWTVLEIHPSALKEYKPFKNSIH